MRYRLYHDPSTSNATTIFTGTLDAYSQEAAISINSENNDIKLKTDNTTRLQVSNSESSTGIISLNVGQNTGGSATTHGELRFARGDQPDISRDNLIPVLAYKAVQHFVK